MARGDNTDECDAFVDTNVKSASEGALYTARDLDTNACAEGIARAVSVGKTLHGARLFSKETRWRENANRT